MIVRAGRVLLSRLSPRITPDELWTLPGGGVEIGEHPRDAVVREVHEETGLRASVSESAHIIAGGSLLGPVDQHAVRLIFEGWVPTDAPEPHVVEVDGSTVDARWHPLESVYDGTVPVVEWALEALRAHAPERHQRLAVHGVARREGRVLLTRISARGHRPGVWTLPGGGVDHGESPAAALVREFAEETGLVVEVGRLLGVHDVHFTGTAPTGRNEDFHGVHLLFEATVDAGEPRVREIDGTTDAVAWVPVADIESGTVPVLDVVRAGLGLR